MAIDGHNLDGRGAGMGYLGKEELRLSCGAKFLVRTLSLGLPELGMLKFG
jgi:hypothetical protein